MIVALDAAVGRARAVGALALLLAALAAGCSPRPSPAPTGPAPVILISIDTLRPDRLTCYGYARPTSPRLAASLCADGVVFEQAIAAAPSTLPSHASMLTGLLPAHHRGSFGRKQAVPAEVTTLAERLAAAGYRTASFNNDGQLDAVWGLDQGFEEYRSLDVDRLRRVAAAGLEWLDRRLAEGERDRLFLFLHTYETHHPYTPTRAALEAVGAAPYHGYLGAEVGYKELRRINHGNAPLSAADLAFVNAAYDAEIRSMDEALGGLVEALRRRGLYDRALIVFTSDHGEEFREHGLVGWHSHTLYDELLRVPLVIKLPGGRAAGTRVPSQVRLVDLVPTVLERLGLPLPAGLDGESLLPLVDGPPTVRRPAISQKDRRGSSSIRLERWKLYDDRLFDLRADPGETRDIAAGHPEIVAALRRLRDEAVAEDPGAASGRAVELSDETTARLKALGYL